MSRPVRHTPHGSRGANAWAALNDAHAAGVGDQLRRASASAATRHEAVRKRRRVKLNTDIGDPEGGPTPMSTWTPGQRRGFFGIVGALGEALKERVYRPRNDAVYREQRLREASAHLTTGPTSISLRNPAVGNRRYARTDGDTDAFSGVMYRSAAELQQPRHAHKPRLAALFDARFMGALQLLGADRDAALATLFGTSISEACAYGMLTGEQKGVLASRNEHGALLALCSTLARARAPQAALTLAELCAGASAVHGLTTHALAVRCDGALELAIALDTDARRFAVLRLDLIDAGSAATSARMTSAAAASAVRELLSAEVRRDLERDAPTGARDASATIGTRGEQNTVRRQMAQVAARSGSIADAEFGDALFLPLGTDALEQCAQAARSKQLAEPGRRAHETGKLARNTVDGRLLARSTELLVFDIDASRTLARQRVALRYHYFVPCQCDMQRSWLRRYAGLYDLAAGSPGSAPVPRTTFARTDFSDAERSAALQSRSATPTATPSDIDRELRSALRRERRQARRVRRAQRSAAERTERSEARYRSRVARESACKEFYEAVWPPESR